jgi:hypothetical protein
MRKPFIAAGCCGLVFLVGWGFGREEIPQQPAGDPTQLITTDNPAKLEKKLNEAAAAGYRIYRAFPGRAHNAVANFLLSGNLDPLAGLGPHETTGAIVTMEKLPAGSANYEYRVIRLYVRLSSWERDINEAAARGFRVVPGYGTFPIRQGAVLGTVTTLITIMEKTPGTSELRHYSVPEARQMGNFEREVNQRFADGYGLIWFGRHYALNAALMEKDGESPVVKRLLAASKMEELEQKLHASAAERFCIVASETLEDPSHGDRLAYLEKCETTPEYIFTKNDEKSLGDFNRAVAGGYRLVPGGIFGQVITLVKAPAGEHYEYRFVKNTAEADEVKKIGYTELPLSYPIRLGGFVGGVLERKVLSTPEVSQRGPGA